MMVGLHGAGKTTTTVKLAKFLKKEGYNPLVVACDVYRPAAVDQLQTLAAQEAIACYAEVDNKKVLSIAKNSLKHAKTEGYDAILWDTAGRLQIDTALIDELEGLKKIIDPNECFLVADSALGQEAVNVAKTFHEAVALTGIVLTKLDGDARGGAALSMKAITQVPIRFSGTGEKLSDFEVFHPDRMAQRILGMGDVVSLVEKAQEHFDADEAAAMEQKMRRADLNFEDFLAQLRQIKKLGSLGSIAKMLPGAGKLNVGQKEEDKFKHSEAIILSMTLKERKAPQMINGSRRMRIAKGAGVEVREVNQLLKEFQMMRKMMKSMKGGKAKKMMKKMGAMQGGQGGIPGLPF
jgi:signal recognition particle subunit SRP54